MNGTLTTPNFDLQVHNSTQLVISTAPPREVTTNCKENASALSKPKTSTAGELILSERLSDLPKGAELVKDQSGI